jgi:hypothetical protein
LEIMTSRVASEVYMDLIRVTNIVVWEYQLQ